MFVFSKRKTATETRLSLVGSDMCIRHSSDRPGQATSPAAHVPESRDLPRAAALRYRPAPHQRTALSTRYCPRGQSLTGGPAGPCAVHRRSTGGQSLHVAASLWQSLLTRRPGHHVRPIRHDLQHSPRYRERAQLAATLAGDITDCICRLGERPSPMFAPCLLGCRVPTR